MVGGARRLRRQRFGGKLAGALAVEPLIGKIGKDAGLAGHQPRSAAIFMHAGAGIEAGGREVHGVAVRAGADDHIAALLLGAPFEPVDIISGEPHV
jgi:hypothetical protein